MRAPPRADDLSFEATLAAKHRGAYLADVDVVVTRLPPRLVGQGDVVVEHRTEGPLMLVDLPPAALPARCTHDDVLPGPPSHVRRDFGVTPQGLRRMVIHFDIGNTVGR